MTWVALAWLGAAGATAWGLHSLDRYVAEGQPDVECRLEWTSLPPWLEGPDGERALDEIAAAADLRADDDFHAPTLCERVGTNLRQSPWVADVHRVVKQPRGIVRIEASFREPFAYVETYGRAYLVDETGVRLPPACSAASLRPADAFVITGVFEAVPEVGQPWEGDDLAAGLRLVRFLRNAAAQGRLTFRAWVKAIDVANFDGRERPIDGKLRLRTILPRCYINWGEAPGEEFPIDASADRKLELLRVYYNEHGGQFPDGWVCDVRGPDGVRRWEYTGG